MPEKDGPGQKVRMMGKQGFRPAALDASYRKNLTAIAERHLVSRFWKKDLSLWPTPEKRKEGGAEVLEWLDLFQALPAAIASISTLADKLRNQEIHDVVFLSFGASGVAAELLPALDLPTRGARFHVLCRIDPLAIRALEKLLDFRRVVFLVASKTGKNLESHALLLYLLAKVKAAGVAQPASRFIAITEDGSYLAALAAENRFQAVFGEPHGFRGRFSGVQHYGLLLGGLCGMDAVKIIAKIEEVQRECGGSAAVSENPAACIAAFLAAAVESGYHRLIVRAPEKLMPLARRLAHLVGCSTCKNDTGIVPFLEVHLADGNLEKSRYTICNISMTGEPSLDFPDSVTPAILFALGSAEEIPAKVFEWEIATALACSLLEVNPFEDADYSDGRDASMQYVEQISVQKQFSIARPRIVEGSLALYVEGDLRHEVSSLNLEHALSSVFNLCVADGYCVFLNYLWHFPEAKAALTECANELSAHLSVPVQVAPGPRYLHLTGQSYKGGPRGGVAFLLTCDATERIEIPGAGYTFGDLRIALALGDFDAMNRRNRPIVRLHLSGAPEVASEELRSVLKKAIKLHARLR